MVMENDKDLYDAYGAKSEEESVAKKIANAEILHLDRRETYVKQQGKDEYSLKLIDDAVESGRISQNARKYLSKYYSNSMYLYHHLYKVLEDSLGKPLSVKFRDLDTGGVTDIIHENGKPVAFSRRCITPSTSVQVEFKDKYGKPLLLILPGIKNIERAIQKIENGGPYYKAYKKDLTENRVNHIENYSVFIPKLKRYIDIRASNKNVNIVVKKLDHKYKTIVDRYLNELKFIGVERKCNQAYFDRLNDIKENLNKEASMLDILHTLEKDVLLRYPKVGSIVKKNLGDRYLLKDYLISLENDKSIIMSKDTNIVSFRKDLVEIYESEIRDNKDYKLNAEKIKRPYERLKDIYRCTIITRYYDNIANVKEKLAQGLNPLSRKDKFFGNVSPHHEGFKGDNKGYRDDKIIYNVNKKDDEGDDKYNVDFDVEIQFKLLAFFERDAETHQIYKEKRALERELGSCYDVERREALEREIYLKDMETRRVYGECLKDYNRKVLETAAEMELEIFRKEWEEKDKRTAKDLSRLDKFMEERKKAENELANGNVVYPEVQKFLKDCLLVSPFKALVRSEDIENVEEIDYSKRINSESKKLVLSDDWVSKANMKSFVRRYKYDISEKYIATISGKVDPKVFEDYKNGEKPDNKWEKEEQEYLKSRDISDINSEVTTESMASYYRAKGRQNR